MARAIRSRVARTLALTLLSAGCVADGAGLGDADDAVDAVDAPADGTGATLSPRWPWRSPRYDVPPCSSWAATVEVPAGSRFFTDAAPNLGPFLGSWAKFTVLAGDPSRLYFQDIAAYPLHLDFAVTHLPPFAGFDRAAFDAATLYDADKLAVLGVVYVSFDPNPREVGVELVGRDPYPPAVVTTVLDLVASALVVTDGGPPPSLYYFPSYDQAPWVRAHSDAFVAAGVAVSDISRWADGSLCYDAPWSVAAAPSGRDWAIGRLVHVPRADLDDAVAAGALTRDDVLLTDAAPGLLPPVAGALTLSPANPVGRAATLAATYDVPFAYLAPEHRAAALALVGHLVAVRLRASPDRAAVGACDVELLDLDGLVPADDLAALIALRAPDLLALPTRAHAGPLTADPATLTPADGARFGGEATRFGLLRRALPGNTPAPAVALSFGLWDALRDAPMAPAATLREELDDRLSGHSWPPDLGRLTADLAALRALLRERAALPPTERDAVLAALTSFDPERGVLLRISTNAEAAPDFTGAGLYPDVRACLADDLDHDVVGPSHCDPRSPAERGVTEAILELYAELYTPAAYLERLRRGVDEDRLGVGVLVFPAAEPADAGADGVVTLADGAALTYLLATQRGAVPVTDPDARPELAFPALAYGPPTIVQWSGVGPLGAPVLDWAERDYSTVAALVNAVARAWVAAGSGNDHARLALAYEQVVPGDTLMLTGFHPVSPRDSAPRLPTYLLASREAHELCLALAVTTSVSALHRAKTRLGLANRGAWLDASDLDRTYLSGVSHTFLDRTGPATLMGAPGALPGWSDRVVNDADGDRVEMSWTWGGGLDARVFTLSHPLRGRVPGDEIPLRTLDELELQLAVNYATPQVNLPFGELTREDVAQLVPCAAAPAEAEELAESAVTSSGVTVEAEVWLSGATPATLRRWGRTRIVGLTSAPLDLTNDWARTVGVASDTPLRVDLLFEPRLDPGLDPALLAELEAADVWQIGVAQRAVGQEIVLVGLDGTVRAP